MEFIFWRRPVPLDFICSQVYVGHQSRSARAGELECGKTERCASVGQVRALARGDIRMLDLAYIFISAAFLGLCILYSFACDQL